MKNIFIRCIKDNKISNYNELEKYLSLMKKTTEKGNLYEYFSKIYLEKYMPGVDKIYLNNEIPKELKMQHGLSLTKDEGIDGLVLMKDGITNSLQVKFRANRKFISYRELSTFGCLTFGSNVTGLSKGIIFTNCDDVDKKFKIDKYILYKRDSILQFSNDKTFWKQITV
jgi:hypothetical protein